MNDDQQELLNELLDLESGLSGWELDFVENLDENFRDIKLTEKQANKLFEIHERKFLSNDD